MDFQLEAQCKWVMAILSPVLTLPPSLCEQLEQVFGPIEYKGKFVAFEGTDYYAQEHGDQLFRGFIAFRGLGSPEMLAGKKLLAAKVEAAWTVDGRRKFNLDLGYMDADKLVLASFKRGPCKLYIGDGVYADLLLKYSGGRFEPLSWAFPDFKAGRYLKSLIVIRQKFKAEIRRKNGKGKV